MTPILIRAAEAVLVTSPLASPYANTNVELVVGVLLFALAGFLMAFVGLSVGRIARPTMPHPEKGTIYECGEPAIGTSWIRYNIRFYTIALVYLIFDVEVVFLFPAVLVLKQLKMLALVEIMTFVLVLAIGLIYAWRYGNLNWVSATSDEEPDADGAEKTEEIQEISLGI